MNKKYNIVIITLIDIVTFLFLPSKYNLKYNKLYYFNQSLNLPLWPNLVFTRRTSGDMGIYIILQNILQQILPFWYPFSVKTFQIELFMLILLSDIAILRFVIAGINNKKYAMPISFLHLSPFFYYIFMQVGIIYQIRTSYQQYSINWSEKYSEYLMIPLGYTLLFVTSYLKFKIELKEVGINDITDTVKKFANNKLLFISFINYLFPFIMFYSFELLERSGIIWELINNKYDTVQLYRVWFYKQITYLIILTASFQLILNRLIDKRYYKYFSLSNVIIFYIFHSFYWNYFGNFEMNSYWKSYAFPVYIQGTNTIAIYWIIFQIINKVVNNRYFHYKTKKIQINSDSLYPEAK